MADEPTPYNPLDKKSLAENVVRALLEKSPQPLDSLTPFIGAGLYAIYYSGDFAPYDQLTRLNKGDKLELPIYVGKAVPEGARRGSLLEGAYKGTALHRRLLNHTGTIREASNLDLADFKCRYLVVEDIWIPLGESLLISRHMPLWNTLLDGFGNNDPGNGRYAQVRSKWDVLHPGRGWALRCAERGETSDDIAAQVVERLKALPAPHE